MYNCVLRRVILRFIHKNEEFSHFEATTFLPATRKFWLSFPPKILNLRERKTEIGPSSVKWKSSSEGHCFENAQQFFFDREHAMKIAKKSINWPKNLFIFVFFGNFSSFRLCMNLCIVLDMKTHFVFSNRHFNTTCQHWNSLLNKIGYPMIRED